MWRRIKGPNAILARDELHTFTIYFKVKRRLDEELEKTGQRTKNFSKQQLTEEITICFQNKDDGRLKKAIKLYAYFNIDLFADLQRSWDIQISLSCLASLGRIGVERRLVF